MVKYVHAFILETVCRRVKWMEILALMSTEEASVPSIWPQLPNIVLKAKQEVTSEQ